jgi:hypothetical protein
MSESNERTGEKEGTFLVTHAEAESAVLKDVDDGQVHPLGSNPGVEEGDVLAGALAPDPPLEVTWQVVSVDERRTVGVERSEEPPTTQEVDIAADQDIGEVTRRERAGTGELHVLTVDPGETDSAAEEVVADEATATRAARMDGVERVEVRARDGVVSVRYMP